MNAIMNKNSADLKDCSLYVALFPCNECAKLIIQSGIKCIIYMSDKHKLKPETVASKMMLDMAGVKYSQFVPRKQQIVIDFNAIDWNNPFSEQWLIVDCTKDQVNNFYAPNDEIENNLKVLQCVFQCWLVCGPVVDFMIDFPVPLFTHDPTTQGSKQKEKSRRRRLQVTRKQNRPAGGLDWVDVWFFGQMGEW